MQPMIDYISRFINSVSGIKALLLDQHTSGMVGMVMPLSELLAREVYYVNGIDSPTHQNDDPSSSSSSSIPSHTPHTPPAQLHHMKAVVFIRPIQHSVDSLKRIIKQNTYKEYHVFFSSFVSDDLLRSLSDVDEAGVVHQVNEYFGDYFAVANSLFSLNCPSTCPLSLSPASFWVSGEKLIFERNVAGILSIMLAMRRRMDVRYSEGSELVKMVAHDAVRRMTDETDLFTFNQRDDTPLLLLLDRRDDPVTPLLHQWTYRAMLHELLGIHNNRVTFEQRENDKSTHKEVVLSPQLDSFYRQAMFNNFGDLGAAIKTLVKDYQRTTKSTAVLETIEDMQRFVDKFPELRAHSNQVSKHVSLVTELAHIVESRQLMSVSELEQELACSDDHGTAIEKVERVLANPKLNFDDKLHVTLLYALRYENARHEIPKLKKTLRDCATNQYEQRRVNAIDEILRYAGSRHRAGDLFSNKTLLSKAAGLISGGLRGVENIYTQHKPLLAETIGNLLAGKLKNTTFPFVEAASYKNKYKTIVAYIVGGVTYEEAQYVHTLNESNSGVRVILGGSTIHNSRSFIDDLLHIDAEERAILLHPARNPPKDRT